MVLFMRESNEKIKTLLLYAVCILVMATSIGAVIFVYTKDRKKEKLTTTATSYGYDGEYVIDPMSDEDFQFWDGIEISEEATTSVEISEMPDNMSLTLEYMCQNPELPSGCESVALTMLLNYYGFDLDKTTIADNYLIFSNDNFVMGFKGNPKSSTGGGAYAPSMANTANRFLIQQGSDLRAINISGTELEDLYPFIAGGTPVMVWSTINLQTPNPSGRVYLYGDTEYQWVSVEHCVILSGYNLETNEVTVYDSISGIMTYDKDEFKSTYDGMWRMAVIIQ